jgi:hypothetical protein
MKKSVVLCLCFIVFKALGVQASSDVFDADFCRNGHSSAWVGACICEKPTEYTGRYCDVQMTSVCHSNKDCPKDMFCSQVDNVSKCVPLLARGSVVVQKSQFVLSDMLLNHQSAEWFCSAYKGGGYRQATRADFLCADIGPLCLDTDVVIGLQEYFGMRGFFWLDAKDDVNAYYADINDGTVYETAKKNIKTIIKNK